MTHVSRGMRIRLWVWVTLCLFFIWQGSAQGEPTVSSMPVSSQQVQIVSNQIGYLPRWPKVAMLLGGEEHQQETAQLVDAENAHPVLSITPGRAYTDPQTGDRLRPLDFTAVTTPGRYYLRYQDSRSPTFQIGHDVYQEPLRLMLRSYYLQRCGVAIDDAETQVRHAACHLQDGTLAHADASGAQGASRPTVGGWHDAGDYGKYVATAAVTLGRLLNLYERYPSMFPDRQLTIPESGNGVSDLLDEMRVEMEWLRSLQREDGAVYRKVSGMSWPKKATPDQDDQPRFVFGVSTPETAKFAAVAALSARIFQAIDLEFARACLAAAQRAWRYLALHPTMQVDWVDGDDQGSGKYLYSEVDQEAALLTDRDDRLWAAVELFVTTQDEHFHRYIRAQIPHFSLTLFEWKDPSSLALLTYRNATVGWGKRGKGEMAKWVKKENLPFRLPDAQTPRRSDSVSPFPLFAVDPLTSLGRASQRTFKRNPMDSRNVRHIQTQIVRRADRALKTAKRSGYRIANDQFVWGSNKMTAEAGITLLHAYTLTGNPAYWRAAIDQVDYLFGRNHFALSFVSNVGERSVQHVCHIPSRVAGITIPGLLVGGPNAAAQCGIAPKGRGPLSYIDHEESYATNENAIDYNASLIALITMLVGEDAGQRTESH